ncbi:MAG: PQQ-binding-like beta-propeller repeat protein [Pyrinomonadaceae bacterium]
MQRTGKQACLLVLLCLINLNGQATTDEARNALKKCWESRADVSGISGLAADDDLVYFANDEGKLSAIEIRTGRIAWVSELAGKTRSAIVLSEGLIVVVSGVDDKPATLTSLATRTGLVAWRSELPRSERYYLTNVNGGLIAVSTEGRIFRIGNADGRLIWDKKVSGEIVSDPKIGDGKLVIATSRNTVEAYDLADGHQKSSLSLDFTPSIVGAGKDSSVIYSDQKGSVFSTNLAGQRNWKFRAGGRIVYVKTVGPNVLIGSSDNFVYLMSVDHGNLVWKRRLPGRIANGGLIGEDRAVFTVIGERSAWILDLDKGRITDQIDISVDDAFLFTPVHGNVQYLLSATSTGVSGFSINCDNEKSGK